MCQDKGATTMKFLVCFVLLIHVPSLLRAAFVQKQEHSCHAIDETDRANLACDTGQRLAILRVGHGYHLNTSYFEDNATSILNCSSVPQQDCELCEADCVEDYPDEVLVAAHENCSAQLHQASMGNVTCQLDLPRHLPEQTPGRCSSAVIFQTVSSYSVVDYACVEDSEVAPLCTSSQREGQLLYALWTPGESTVNMSDVNTTSCRCSVTSGGSTLFTRALDVRIPGHGVTPGCSRVTVYDYGGTKLDTDCSDNTTLLFDLSSQPTGLTATRPPVDVIMMLDFNNLPDVVWIGFQNTGPDPGNLTLTCYNAGENLERRHSANASGVDSGQQARNNDESSTSLAAIIGGTVASVVLVACIVYVCFVIYRRKRAPSQTESTTWWEKTREEDRIAEMSQLGPSSRVIIDTGRHMGYGKHPPTRRRFPTSDNNLPVSIVPGSAVGQDHAQAETGEDFDAAGQNGDNLSPGQLDETATGSTASAAGNDSSDPGVLHNASAKSNPVVVVTDGGVKFYDIPPLTVKELE